MNNEFEITDYGALVKYTGNDEHVIIPEGVRFFNINAFDVSPKSMELPESMESVRIGDFADGGANLVDEDGFYIAGDFLFGYDGFDGTISVPDGIRVIYSAFKFKNLVSVTLPESVKIIHEGFSDCFNLQSISMPGVVSIDTDAFNCCRSLEKIVFPETAKTVGNHAFQGCESLREVILNDGLEIIGEGAFKRCKNLEKITIPDSVQSIGKGAFSECSELSREDVRLPQHLLDGDPYFYEHIGVPDANGCIVIDGVLKSYHGSGEIAVISDGVTFIEEEAFNRLKIENKVHKVHLPVTLREVEGYALDGFEVETDSSVFNTTEKLIKELSGALGSDPLNLAHVILFQSGKRWVEAVERELADADTQKVYDNVVGVLLKEKDKSTDTVAGKAVKFAIAHQTEIAPASLKEMYEVLQSNTKRWKKANAAFENEFGTSFDEQNKSEEHEPAQEREIEQYVRDHYNDKDIYPEAISACDSRIHFADSDSDTCSIQMLTLLVNEYVDEFYNVSHEITGTVSVRRDIDEHKTLYASEVADTIAAQLNREELISFLKKLAFGNDYRKYLIAYARYAGEDDIKDFCVEINKRKRGNAKNKYMAANMKNALYISDTAAAFEFLEKNGDIEKYAGMRGMTPDEYRKDVLMQNSGMNEKGECAIDADAGLEPVIDYDPWELKSRYSGLELTNKERTKLKSALKAKGVDVRSDANEGKYDHRQGKYVFSDTNKMNLGNSMTITYHIDEKTRSITFASDLKLKRNASKYEVNTILLEMDRTAARSRIDKDEADYFKKKILDGFTAAQIMEFIDYAENVGSVKCSSVLQKYKNEKYPGVGCFFKVCT